MTSPDLIQEHTEECCFLWHQRRIAVFQPNLGLEALERLDERLLAHLDGLRVAGDGAIDSLLALAQGEAGAAWAAAVLCAESGRLAQLDGMLGGTVAEAAAEAAGWMDEATAGRAMIHWTTTGGAALAVAAAAAGFRGLTEPRLAGWAASADTPTACAALASALRLGIAPVVEVARTRAGEPSVARAAQTVLALAGSAEAAESLLVSLAPVRSWSLPLIIAGRCSTPPRLRTPRPGLGPWAGCMLAGSAGDPNLLPDLIARMEDPRTARCAGEALSAITGADLRALGLTRPAPADADTGPSEDPADTDVAMDPDDDLPWPDRSAVEAWWKLQPAATPGRLLAGLPVAQAGQQLATGNQRLRWAASVELAKTGERRLFPVDAPAATQRRLLQAG